MRNISLFFKSVVKSLTLLIFLAIASNSALAQSAAEGATLFKQKCTACHALNSKVVGPALKGITEKRSEEWLIKWVRNSQAMIAAGDPEAVKIFNEFKPAVMTPFPELTEDN